MVSSLVVEVKGVSKIYSEKKGVFDISFGVEEGEFFGLVGPNGAGKTTLIEIIEGIRVPDRGESFVCGVSYRKKEVRSYMGVQLQENIPFARLRVEEILRLACSAYPDGFTVGELIERVGLSSERRVFYPYLSGGNKQKLRLALALAGKPRVLFLDEPTTGLDPHARRSFWELLQRLRQELSITFFLTSHYMEEVEFLCDRVMVLDEGKIVASGSPEEIIRQYGSRVWARVVADSFDSLDAIAKSGVVSRVEWLSEKEGRFQIVSREEFLKVLGDLIHGRSLKIFDLEFDSSSLEDVVVSLTKGES